MNPSHHRPRHLYLDLDGVLIRHDGGRSRPAEGAYDLLRCIGAVAECFWLTTHCTNGDATPVHRHLAECGWDMARVDLAIIRPTTWQTSKLEAIDRTADWFWLDDSPLQAELRRLGELGMADRCIRIDLARHPGQLVDVAAYLLDVWKEEA